MKPSEEIPKSKRIGWKVTGYILAVLTVLLSLVALQRITTFSNTGSDPAEQLGRVIGTLITPVIFGYLARYCFRKSRN